MAQDPASGARRALHVQPSGVIVILGTAILFALVGFAIEVIGISILLKRVGSSPLLPDLGISLAIGTAAAISLGKLSLSAVIAARRVSGRWTLVQQGLRLLVFTLSVALGLVVFGVEAISPRAKAVLDARTAEIQTRQDQAIAALEVDLADRKAAAMAEADRTRQTETAADQARLAQLYADLDKERQIGGQDFYGERSKNIDKQILETKAHMAARTDTVTADARATLADIAAQGQVTRIAIETRAKAERAALDRVDIASLDEAQNPAVLVVAKIAATLTLREKMSPVVVTVVLTLLLTMAVECVPMALATHVLVALGEMRTDAAAQRARRAAHDQARREMQEDASLMAGQVTAAAPVPPVSILPAGDQPLVQRAAA